MRHNWNRTKTKKQLWLHVSIIKLHCIQIQEKRMWIRQIWSVSVPSRLPFSQRDIFPHCKSACLSMLWTSLIFLFLTINSQLVVWPYTIFLLFFLHVTSSICLWPGHRDSSSQGDWMIRWVSSVVSFMSHWHFTSLPLSRSDIWVSGSDKVLIHVAYLFLGIYSQSKTVWLIL